METPDTLWDHGEHAQPMMAKTVLIAAINKSSQYKLLSLLLRIKWLMGVLGTNQKDHIAGVVSISAEEEAKFPDVLPRWFLPHTFHMLRLRSLRVLICSLRHKSRGHQIIMRWCGHGGGGIKKRCTWVGQAGRPDKSHSIRFLLHNDLKSANKHTKRKDNIPYGQERPIWAASTSNQRIQPKSNLKKESCIAEGKGGV